MPPSSSSKLSQAGWIGSLQSSLLSGNADFSLAHSGVATAPSVQPQCSPFPARFKDLQIQKTASPTCEASTGPPGSLCPAYQTKPHKQLREKGPTFGPGQCSPSNTV